MPKLYDVPMHSMVRVVGDAKAPPCHREFAEAEVLRFLHIDGMYSYCIDSEGNPVHLSAWAEVEVLDEHV